MAIQDEGSNYVKPALDTLRRLGATEPVLPDFRGSFALVGYAGVNKLSWIAQKIAKRGLGPSEISLKIPLIPQPHRDVSDENKAILCFLFCFCFFGLFLFLYHRNKGFQ